MNRSFSLFLLALVPVTALAHAGATGIVLERMEGMKSLGAAMKAIKGELGSVPDAVVLRNAANTIRENAGQHMTDRFPAGSLPHVSEAAPAIWIDFDRFSVIAARLEAQAGHLTDIADALDGGDVPPVALETVFRNLGATCKDCHADFRIKK